MLNITANANGLKGFQSFDDFATFTGNTARHNAQHGFDAHAGLTDGGGNEAFGNGIALRCINVVCGTP